MSADSLPEKFGRFRVIDELGRGAMGVVYRANDPALGRTVAIKTIALTGSAQERDIHESRFLQEGRAAGGLSHASIVTIYDVGREADVAFIAMELIEGRDLRDLIREVSLRPAQSVAITAAVAEALAYAHERGVIHRDVKPGNIMVLADDRVKIMDFGIAQLHEPMVKTQTGVMLGSPQYMSPEQITGQEVDHRADIFSLGLVLYEMLTGAKPFQGEDIPELMFKVANMPATPPSHLAPDLPPVVDYIVARALKKKPDERYASARDLAKDLRECLAEVAASESRNLGEGTEGDRIPRILADGSIEVTRPDTGRLHAPEAPLELRPSQRFDSKRGLARLAELPAEGYKSTSRAGWTMPVRREPKKLDRARALIVSAYVLAVFAALAILLTGCGGARAKLEKLERDDVVVAFGDSLTFGTGAQAGESYPAALERSIRIKVVNAGVPGETSAEGLQRFPAVLDETHPKLVILCHGGNDFLRHLEEARAARNIREMIALARARNVAVVLLAPPKPGLPPSVPGFYREIAAELGVPLDEDVLRRVLLDNSLKSDMVHPNGKGYAQVAGALQGVLQKAGAI